ncbi:MAG: hypothetical protein HOV68_08760 [Streptomycetaceae bacterium]|nr:hypothetical protein [Streptomycetaceae bacterium]
MTDSLRRRRYVVAGVVVVVFVVLIAGGAGLGAAMYVTAQQEAAAEAQRADAAQATVAEVCADKAAEGGEECTPEQLRGEKGDTGATGAQGPGPTDAQVYAAVALYMSGRDLVDPADLAAAVADYIAEHPPADGADAPPVSGEQILAAVASYLAANPPPKGDPGEDGRPPTSEEILAAVAAWFAENPGPYCKPGFEPREADIPTVDQGIIHALVCAQAAE